MASSSENRAEKAMHVLVATLLGLTFLWLRHEIQFRLTSVGSSITTMMENLGFGFGDIIVNLLLFIPLLFVLVLQLANYFYVFCILVFLVSLYMPLPARLNLHLSRGVRYLFVYLFRGFASVIRFVLLLTVGEYLRRRGARAFLCYVVLPFLAIGLIAVGVWGWRSELPRVYPDTSHAKSRIVPIHKLLAWGLKADELHVTPTYTKLTCVWILYWNTSKGAVFSSKTHLIDQAGTKYYPVVSEGLEIDEREVVYLSQSSRHLRASLYFPPLPAETQYVSLRFFNPNGDDTNSVASINRIWLKGPFERLISHFRK